MRISQLIGYNKDENTIGGSFMISSAVTSLMLENKETFLIPAENVANVMCGNPLNHALLVLSQVKYSKIPVLDKEDHLAGLLSLADVVEKMLALENITMDNLHQYTVADVMETEVPVVEEDWDLEEVLHLLVDASFLPVVDKDKIFKGIVTRKEILKAVNHTFHQIQNRNFMIPKIGQSKKKIKVYK